HQVSQALDREGVAERGAQLVAADLRDDAALVLIQLLPLAPIPRIGRRQELFQKTLPAVLILDAVPRREPSPPQVLQDPILPGPTQHLTPGEDHFLSHPFTPWHTPLPSLRVPSSR